MGVHDSGGKYSHLASDDEFRDSHELLHLKPVWTSITHNSPRRYRLLIGCATAFALVLSIVQLVLTVDVRTHIKEKPQHKHKLQHKPLVGHHAGMHHPSASSDPAWPCGITAEEARLAGCSFDLGLVAWVPHECYNKELDDSFRSRVPFDVWLPNDDNTGPDLTKPVTTEKQFQELLIQMVDLGWPGHSWGSLYFHDAHCMHTWEYLHQAVLKGKQAPTSITSFSHTTHCTYDALLDTSNITYREIAPTAHNRFPACVDLADLAGEMPDLY